MELLKKLRINTELPLWLVNAPDGCLHLFGGIEIKQKPGKQKPVGQLMLFAANSMELQHYLPVIDGYVGHDTLFWICYPKKTGAIASDLIQMQAWDIVFNSGYRGQTSVSIDDDWTGLRVTNAPRKKPSDCDLPMVERKVEGIDFVKRTVQLPADGVAVLEQHKGMSAFFNTLSFTTKREYHAAITGAKKDETRKSRIKKMEEELLQKMQSAKPKSLSKGLLNKIM